MRNIVECVPNFSEGRDRAVVDRIAAAIESVDGLTVMDVEMDHDHHRSVITFVGEKAHIGEGALRAIGTAAELIDLNRHAGVHPRLGATDVVPFVPVRDVTLAECVAIARQVGEEAARRFSIPVFLYEAAATIPERVQLEKIRRGQFEKLRDEIGSVPERVPDFGPPRIHPTAGATVVGARKFLIAYNMNLDTSDVEVARKIARAVRFSSGGLPFVKAMGVPLNNRQQAQVSMNLTDFEEMPLHRVFERVQREARLHGVSVTGSEIIGLIPQKAIDMSAEYFLRVQNFSPHLIFENRLEALLEKPRQLSAMKVGEFLDSVAEASSVPGGGSVSALAGALAAALGKMTLGFTRHRKKYEEQDTQLLEHQRVLEDCLDQLRHGMDRDAEAYALVVAAQRMPRASENEQQLRTLKLHQALEHATEVPMEIALLSYRVMRSLAELRSISNPNLRSDLNTGFWLAMAATQSALENVATNLDSLPSSEFATHHRHKLEELKDQVKQLSLPRL